LPHQVREKVFYIPLRCCNHRRRLRLPDKKTGQKKTKNTKEHNRQQQASTQTARTSTRPRPPTTSPNSTLPLASTQRSRSPLLKQPEPPLAPVHILPDIPIGPRGRGRDCERINTDHCDSVNCPRSFFPVTQPWTVHATWVGG
jgi:hypothetical protein